MRLIGVVGAGECSPGISRTAYDVGVEIARRDAILLCGGLSGVMAAAAHGARDTGGITVGLLPGDHHSDANPHILIPLPTGLGHARNVIIARASHGLVAVAGGYGTLSEIAMALKMGKPVVGLNSWNLDDRLHSAASPREAVDWLFDQWNI